MKLKKSEYIQAEFNGNISIAYCYTEHSTIPLETYHNINSIEVKEEIEGNTVFVIEEDYNHLIFIDGEWCVAQILTKEKFIKKKRESILNSMLTQ